MADYLLDCNHISSMLHKVSPLRERMQHARRAGHRFISCFPVLCELEVGIQQTTQPEENRRRLNQLLLQVRLWPLDHETTRLYGGIYIELRNKGFALSQVDMILAALARQHKLIVLTSDLDFAALPDLVIEDWNK